MSGNYTLQILHASDFEGGVEAVGRAKNFAAIVDRLEDQVANSITLSSGDNFIPGPFTAAGTDGSVRDEIASYYEQFFGLAAGSLTGIRNATTGFNVADIAILNAIGIQASTIGNHEFDLGPNAFAGSFDFIASLPAAPGQPTLANITSIGAQFPYLSSNLNFASEGSLSGLFTTTLQDAGAYLTTAAELSTGAGIRAEATGREIAPWTSITKGGQTLGIVAVTTQVQASITTLGNVTVLDPNGDGGRDNMDELAAILQPQINQMIALGINKIILMSHLQNIANERLLVTKLSGVDVIIGGGSHTLFADATDLVGPGDVVGGGYPEFYTGLGGGRVALINTEANYKYVGRLVIDFDAAGNIIESSVNAVTSGAYVTTDIGVDRVLGNNDGTLSAAEQALIFADGTRGGEVQQITDAIGAVINLKDSAIWGYSSVYLEGDRIFGRNQEINLGSLSADANLIVAKNALGIAFVGSLKNGGGIRSAIGNIDPATGAKTQTLANPSAGKPAGAISTLDIENALRFDNKLVVFDTTASGLKTILEYGLGLPANAGGYAQIGGLKVAFDPSRAAGNRIVSLAMTDIDGNVIARIVENGVVAAGAPATLSMTSLSFTANGGDGYPIKANATNFRYILFDGSLSTAIDPTLDLTSAATAASVGQSLATILGEQRAFQIILADKYGTPARAYSMPDTAQSLDTRIQNLNVRGDTALDAPPVNGDASSQILHGGVGDDSIAAGGGNDTVAGGVGDDTIDGGSGNDQLFGGDGRDMLIGGTGADVLYGGTGLDIAAGGVGDDGYTVEDISDVIIENPGEGTDSAFVFVDNWTAPANLEAVYLFGGATRVLGAGAADTLVANATLGSIIGGGGGRDTLFGQAGDDSLSGDAGDDVIYAGAGQDTLTGGAGQDQMLGGGGADIFGFTEPGWGYDQVFDFSRAEGDRFDMRGSGATNFAQLGVATIGPDTAVTLGASRFDVYGVTGLLASDFIFA